MFKYRISIIFLFLSFLPVFIFSKGNILNRGKLLIYFDGKYVGSEVYTLKEIPGGYEGSSIMSVILPRGGGNVAFTYKTKEIMDRKFNPIHYEDFYTVNGRKNYIKVDFKGGKAVDNCYMAGLTLNRTANVHKSFRLLEEAVFYQYWLIYKKYEVDGGGDKRTINIYIPKIAKEIPVKIDYVGSAAVNTGKGLLEIKKFMLEMGSMGITFAVDKKGKLIKVFSPEQKWEIVNDFNYNFTKTDKK